MTNYNFGVICYSMVEGSNSIEGRVTLPKGRISNAVALDSLELLTGLSKADLLARIPELNDENLAFGLMWASDPYRKDHPVGIFNANAVRDFLVVHVPMMNVAGDTKNDLTGRNASYHVNVATREVKGFSDFYAAQDDLSETHATAKVSSAEMQSAQPQFIVNPNPIAESLRRALENGPKTVRPEDL